jgi:integrase
LSESSPALLALADLRKRQEAEREISGTEWTESGLAFTTTNGQPLDYRVVVRRHFKKLLKAAKLPAIRPYDLRHTSATLLLAAGENVKVVSERLGHTSAALTLDVYSHVLPHMQQQAAERLELIVGAPNAAK